MVRAPRAVDASAVFMHSSIHSHHHARIAVCVRARAVRTQKRAEMDKDVWRWYHAEDSSEDSEAVCSRLHGDAADRIPL